MNSAYFAIGCILMVLVIYWGSTESEPGKLASIFGQRPPKNSESERAKSATKKKDRR
jgi:hypothetical protein